MNPSLFLNSSGTSNPLRLGILLDSQELPACFSEVIDHIKQSNFANLELLIFNCPGEQASHTSSKLPLFTRLFNILRNPRQRNSILFSAYERLDRRRLTPSDDPITLVDCSSQLESIPSIRVSPITNRFTHRFPPEAIH